MYNELAKTFHSQCINMDNYENICEKLNYYVESVN